MSTLTQPHLEPAWKQEVNRRIAAHKNRKAGVPAPATAQPQTAAASRAAQAAARVAERYAKAPSYSQMQAEEARVAVRAAEIATQVALEAQAVAESALAEMHAASVEAPLRGPAVIESMPLRPSAETAPAQPEFIEPTPSAQRAVEVAAPVFDWDAPAEPAIAPTPQRPAAPVEQLAPEPIAPPTPAPVAFDRSELAVRWEPDMPVRSFDRRPATPPEPLDLLTEDWWTPAQVSATLRNEPIQIDSQPAHANLIEFPRELIATRKMRPRLAEAAAAPRIGADGQLSIFEVDPGSVSTEPQAVEPARQQAASTWVGPEWSGIELDAMPAVERAPSAAEAAQAARQVHLAPIGRRLMTLVVDGAFILAAFFAAAMFAVSKMAQPPVGKSVEVLLVLGIVLTGFLYHALFFSLGVSTPGMRYAGIALSTFDDDSPTRRQLRRRLGAMVLSLAPMGLGIAWAIFDEDHLSWHDRISQTYLRKR